MPGGTQFPLTIDLREIFDASAVSFSVETDFPAPVLAVELLDATAGTLRVDPISGINTTLEFSVTATEASGSEASVVFLVDLIAENPKLYVKHDAQGTGVGLDWDNAIPDLQSAFAIATPGTEIWVASGVYFPDEGYGTAPDDPSAKFFTKDGFSIYGGFLGTETELEQRPDDGALTVLSGDIGQDDVDDDGNSIAESHLMINGRNSYTILSISDEDIVLDRLTITAGSAISSPADTTIVGGGAAYIGQSSVAISNCQIIGNRRMIDNDSISGFGNGGAMRITQSDVTFESCNFDSNAIVINGRPIPISSDEAYGTNGGAISASSSDVDFLDCRFQENQIIKPNDNGIPFLSGGAISITDERSKFSNCHFIGNSINGFKSEVTRGGALAIFSEARCDFIDCSFESNSIIVERNADQYLPSGGAIYAFTGNLDIVRCAFRGNQVTDTRPIRGRFAGRGGAIYNGSGAELDCRFCVFSGNASGGSGGAIYNNQTSEFNLFRCTLAGNQARELGGALYDSSFASGFSKTFSGSLIWGNSSTEEFRLPQTSVFTSQGINLSNVIAEGIINGDSSDTGNGLWRLSGENEDLDPQFVAPITSENAPTIEGDYRLIAGSPAIDNSRIFSFRPDFFTDLAFLHSDLDGDADGVSLPDRGAYEFFNPVADSDQDGFTDELELVISGRPLALAPPSIRSSILDEDGTVENLEFQLDVPSALPSLIEFVIEHSLDLGIASSWSPLDTAAPEILDLGTGDSRVTIRPAAAFSSPASGRRFFRIRMEEDTE